MPPTISPSDSNTSAVGINAPSAIGSKDSKDQHSSHSGQSDATKEPDSIDGVRQVSSDRTGKVNTIWPTLACRAKKLFPYCLQKDAALEETVRSLTREAKTKFSSLMSDFDTLDDTNRTAQVAEYQGWFVKKLTEAWTDLGSTRPIALASRERAGELLDRLTKQFEMGKSVKASRDCILKRDIAIKYKSERDLNGMFADMKLSAEEADTFREDDENLK